MPDRRLVIAAIAVPVLGALAWQYGLAPQKAPTDAAGAPIVQVSVPQLAGDALAGKTAFNTYCATCHGIDAAGQDGVAPPLVHVIYEPNHHGDAAFHLAAQRGVRAHHWPFGDMPPVEGVSRAELTQIVAYVRTLQRANGIN